MTDLEIREALAIARELEAAGVPLFVASPCLPNCTPLPGSRSAHEAGKGHNGSGYHLPKLWQTSQPRPTSSAVDRWKPGWGIAMVGGHLADILDNDPRSGGAESMKELYADGLMPRSYGRAGTPSGGTHDLIASLRIAKAVGVLPGIDLQSGQGDGEGRGFAWISPTVKVSKVDGLPHPYRWTTPPDVALLLKEAETDDSGAALAGRVLEQRAAKGKTGAAPQMASAPSADALARVRALAVELAAVLPGYGYPEILRLAFMAGQYVGAGQVGQQQATEILVSALDAWTFQQPGDKELRAQDIRDQVAGGMSFPRAWDPPRSSSIGGVALSIPGSVSSAPLPQSDGWTRGKEKLNVGNAAIAHDWLRDELGRRKLAGFFRQQFSSRVVHIVSIGEDGYRPPAVADDEGGPAQVHLVDPGGLTSAVQIAWACYREVKVPGQDEPTKTPALFPEQAAKLVLKPASVEALPHLRTLKGVTHAPMLRRDGTLLDQPGYDPATGHLYLPDPELVVPSLSAAPTPADVATAREYLLHMVSGFPFETLADRGAYLGMLLTPLLRSLLPPEARKLCVINAHQAGSGKTLLAKILGILHGMVFKVELPPDEPEMRKWITTVLTQETAPVVVIDNVRGMVRSGSIDGLTTSHIWTDRKLGGNDSAKCTNDRLWVITANNATIGGDLARRTIFCTIDPGRAHPELRRPDEFAIPDLIAWATANRGNLIHALLTLVRAWVVAGRPDAPGYTRSTDSYAGWLATVNGILAHAGIPGGFDADPASTPEGEDDQELAEFIDAAHRVFGDAPWTVKELLGKVTLSPMSGTLPNPERPLSADDMLPAELHVKAVQARDLSVIGTSLGRWLNYRQNRHVGAPPMHLARGGGKGRNGVVWRVVVD